MNLVEERRQHNSEEPYSEEDSRVFIIRILQKYKTAKSKVLNKRIHLIWKEGVIDWAEVNKSVYRRDPEIEREIKRELSKINSQINFDATQIQSVTEQYNAGLLCQLVEFWLSELSPKEAEVIFRAYIDHDYEKKYGYYRGLSEREIAERLSVNPTTIMRIKKRAMKKINSIINS